MPPDNKRTEEETREAQQRYLNTSMEIQTDSLTLRENAALRIFLAREIRGMEEKNDPMLCYDAADEFVFTTLMKRRQEIERREEI